ncbi:MAG: RNA polymerase sigma factor [Eubacterium sp.]|nr:RNA polymerase sigma factor [Eubacterium sp.]
MTDDELIKKIRDGDEKSAEELVTRYYPAILRYCRWHCSSDMQAEDLTQETFLRVFKNLPEYRKRGQFKSWLYTIASHLCIDESRKTTWHTLDDDLPDEHSVLSEVENRDEIERMLQKLSPQQREAVILRYGEQMGFAQIAKITGCTMRTAQSRVRCALEIMRRGRKR